MKDTDFFSFQSSVHCSFQWIMLASMRDYVEKHIINDLSYFTRANILKKRNNRIKGITVLPW
jgi:hypothetical protein